MRALGWAACRVAGLGLLFASSPSSASADETLHVVQPGETLSQIALVATGDASRWLELYRANRDQIKDPSRLYPGQKLSIPTLGPASAGVPEDAAGATADASSAAP